MDSEELYNWLTGSKDVSWDSAADITSLLDDWDRVTVEANGTVITVRRNGDNYEEG